MAATKNDESDHKVIKKKVSNNSQHQHNRHSSTRSHHSPLISHPPPLPPRSTHDNGRRSTSISSAADILILERKVLLGVTVLTMLGFVLWVISVSTDYWFTVHVPAGATYLNNTQTYFMRSNSGLWRICRTEFRNQTGSAAPAVITMCRYHQLFPTKEEVQRNPQIDRTILHYTRTETAFSIISIVLMVMGFGFSIYTFFEHRYMFKRLASGVHFLTAATVLVVVEVLVNSVNYEANYLPERHPKGAHWFYGFSFFLACLSFAFYVIAGLAFLICSRKRKGDKAPSELYALADEPHILGRV